MTAKDAQCLSDAAIKTLLEGYHKEILQAASKGWYFVVIPTPFDNAFSKCSLEPLMEPLRASGFDVGCDRRGIHVTWFRPKDGERKEPGTLSGW